MSTPPPPYDHTVAADAKLDVSYNQMSDALSEKVMLQKRDDIEAVQPRSPLSEESASGRSGAEYRVPARTKYLYLSLYFGLNLGLTLFNKAILGKVSKKPDVRTYDWHEVLF